MTEAVVNPAVFWSSPLVAAVLGESLHPGGTDLTLELVRAAGLRPGAAVLDVGCGRGASARHLAEAGYQMTGVDVSPLNVEVARRTAPTCTFRLTDAGLTRLEGPYDAILSECALCLSGDMQSTLRRFRELLRPEGSLLLSDVTLEADAPDALRGSLAFAACLGGASGRTDLVRSVDAAGFKIRWQRDVSRLVRELRDRVRERIDVDGLIEVFGLRGHELERVVRSAEQALEDGTLGYVALVAFRDP